MNKKNVFNLAMLAIVIFSFVFGVLTIKNKMFVGGKDAKYWHDLYTQETLSSQKLKNCVNAGTILSPAEMKIKPMFDMATRVRNNCQIFW